MPQSEPCIPADDAARAWLAQAAAWDRATHKRGRHGGVLGGRGTTLRVYEALLRGCLAHRSGPVALSHAAIAAAAGVSICTVGQALPRLHTLGMVQIEPRRWQRDLYTAMPPERWATDQPLPSPVAFCDPDAVKAGRQLRAARALVGWSAAQLAHEAGLVAATVCRLEAARMQGRPPTWDAIRNALRVAGAEMTPEGGVAPCRFASEAPAGHPEGAARVG